MKIQDDMNPQKNVTTQSTVKAELPRYETPRIQAMSEQDILKSFQITQSMAGWWTTPSC